MRNTVGLVVVVLAALGASSCKKAESLGFEPSAPLVIESDKGATLPRVVGKTADGEVVELKEPIGLTVLPVGVVEIQGDKLIPTKNGKAKISAAVGELVGSLDVTVRIIDEVKVTCPLNPCVVRVGEDVSLVGQVMGLGAAFDAELTWTQTAETVAKLDKGKLTGVAPGKTTVTVETAGEKHSVDVEVRAPLEEVRMFCPWPPMFVAAKPGASEAIKDRSCEAAVGERMKLFSETLAGGAPAEEPTEWSSSDNSVLVVQGELTPSRAGGSVVTLRSGTAGVEMPVAVTPKKKGAPPCDDSNTAWNVESTQTVKATIKEAAWEETVLLRCQGRPSTECADTAYADFNRNVPTFGLDLDSSKRLLAFFTEETARRCCCAKK